MINDLLKKFEEKYPTFYGITMIVSFILGCIAIWGIMMLVKYITTII